MDLDRNRRMRSPILHAYIRTGFADIEVSSLPISSQDHQMRP